MMTDELHARFDLPLTLDTPEGRVLGGSRRADGRGVAIHQLDRLSSASRARLLAQVESAITAGRDDLSLEQVDGATMVITPMLTPGTTLSAWLEELTSQSTPAADQGPPVAGEFTRMFSARPVTGAPEPPAEEQAAAVQGEFTRQFAARPIDVPPVAPPAAAMSQAPPATLPPADPPASSTPKVGSFTALFGAPSSPSSDDPLFTKGSEGVGTSGSPSAPDAAPPTIRISLKLPTPPVNAPPLSPHPADTPQERSPVSMPGDQLTAGSIGPDLAIAVPSGEISPDAATVILQAFELPQPGSLTSPETALTSTPPASAVTPTPSVGQAGGSADAAIFEVEPSVPPVAPPTIAHAPPVSPAAPPTIRHEPPALAAPPTIRHEPPAPPAAPPIIAHAPSTPPAAPPTIADVPPAPPAAPAGGGFTEIFGAPTPAPAPPAGNPVNPSAPAAGAGQSAPAGPGEFTQLFLAQSGTPSPTPPPPPYPAGGGDGGSLGGLPPLGRDGHGGSGRADSPPPLKVKLFPDAAPQSGGESTAPPSGSATGMMRAAPGSSPGMESSPSLIVRLPSRPTETPPPSTQGQSDNATPQPASPAMIPLPPLPAPSMGSGRVPGSIAPPITPPGAHISPPHFTPPRAPAMPGLPPLPGSHATPPAVPGYPQPPRAPGLPGMGGLPAMPGQAGRSPGSMPGSIGPGSIAGPVIPQSAGGRPPSEFTQVLQGFQGAPSSSAAAPGSFAALAASPSGPPKKKPSILPLIIVINVVVIAAVALVAYFMLRG